MSSDIVNNVMNNIKQGDFAKAFDTIGETILKAAHNMGEQLKDSNLIKDIGNFFKDVKEFSGKAFEATCAKLKEFGEKCSRGFDKFAKSVGTVCRSVADCAMNAGKEMASVMKGFGEAFGDIANIALNIALTQGIVR